MMNRNSIALTPVCISYCLIMLLVLQSATTVQSIALSSICGQFGHSCFGGNWGKRELSRTRLVPDTNQETSISTNDDAIDVPHGPYKNSFNEFLVEQLRSQLVQQRLRQLLDIE